jgi:hypothetical protein
MKGAHDKHEGNLTILQDLNKMPSGTVQSQRVEV